MTESNFDFNIDELVNKESISKAIQERLQEDIAQNICWKVQDIVKEQVLAIIEPDIKELIESEKQAILEGVKESLPEIAKAVSAALVASATKNLNGYGGTDIMKKLFS